MTNPYMRLLLSGGKATLSAGDGLNVGFKRAAVCVVDEAGKIAWRGVVDTHPEALSRALQRWGGSMTPWLVRELAKVGFPVVCMDPMTRALAHEERSRLGKRTTASNH